MTSQMLIDSCESGDWVFARHMIAKGADPNSARCIGDGQTPLHFACRYGQDDFVEYLIKEHQCNPNRRDDLGNTPLHYACSLGRLESVKTLICEGNCMVNVINGNNETALHLACSQGQLEVVKYLVTEGHCGANLIGDPPLFVAWRKNQLKIVKFLIENGHCNPNCTGDKKETLLHLASQKGSLEMVQLLIEEGHYSPEQKDANGETPLHKACWLGHLKVIKYLIKKGCNPECTDSKGETPLHKASWWGYLDVVTYLLKDQQCNVDCNNSSGETPLDKASRKNNIEIILELLRYGANPANAYEEYGQYIPLISSVQPVEPAIRMFMIGDYGSGKSTLAKSLKLDRGGISKLCGRLRPVPGMVLSTAGIVSHEIQSPRLGHIMLYDFSGHEAFSPTHDVMLRSSMTNSSAATFLIVADLRLSSDEFKESILNQLSTIENQSSSLDPKPHIVIVGTHTDRLLSRDQQSQKQDEISSLVASPRFKSYHFVGFIAMNCRYAESFPMSELRRVLRESYSTLRISTQMPINTYCLLQYILTSFRERPAISVQEVLSSIRNAPNKKKYSRRELLRFIPDDTLHLMRMFDELSRRGNLLILWNEERIENSWIILDEFTILSRMTGKLFSSPTDVLANSGGVVPLSKIRACFPNLDADTVVKFLCDMLLCGKVSNHKAVHLLRCATRAAPTDSGIRAQTNGEQITTAFDDTDDMFFFPGYSLVSAIPSDSLWEPSEEFGYRSGIVFRCSQTDQFFTPRFFHVLLLRLASAILSTDAEGSDDLSIAQCHIWNSGIHWVSRAGTEGLVEMEAQGRKVTATVRCRKGSEFKCIQLRSAITSQVLKTKEQFCPKIQLFQLFIRPSDVDRYLSKPTAEMKLFSYADIAKAIIEEKPGVIDHLGHMIDFSSLLYFEPYAFLGEGIVRELFDDHNQNDLVADDFLYRIADRMHKNDLFGEMLTSFPMNEGTDSSINQTVKNFRTWRLTGSGTYLRLRKEFDRFSIFAGRTPFYF